MGETGRFRTYWQEAGVPRGNPAARSPESVASVLRHERLVQGYDLSEVARSLNIREGHLEALEEGRFRDLPPLVYARGFVAAYAGFLQLDRSEIVDRFQIEATNDNKCAAAPSVQPFKFRPEVDAETRRRPGVVAIVAGLLLAAFAYSLWHASVPDSREVVLAVPPLPSRFEAAGSPVAVVPVTPAPTVYAGAGEIVLRSYGEGWIQLRTVAGQRIASLVLRPGQSYTVPKGESLRLSTGSLEALTVLVDGRPVALASPAGRARVDVLLDPVRLLAGTAVLN